MTQSKKKGQVSRHRLDSLTWPEFDERRKKIGVAIVPLGATEQHGPALSLRTDTARAEAIADQVADRLDGIAIVTPTIPVGMSENHMGFPGTLALQATTLMAIVRDVVLSLRRHGIRRVFILTGHGGNGPTVDVTLGELRRDQPDLLLAWSGLTPIVADIVREQSGSEVGGHSSEIETAQAWYVDPDLVRVAQLSPGSSRLDDLDAAGRLSRSHPGINFARTFDQLSTTGAMGDPRAASFDMGERLVSTIVERLTDFLRGFAALDLPTTTKKREGVPDEE